MSSVLVDSLNSLDVYVEKPNKLHLVMEEAFISVYLHE